MEPLPEFDLPREDGAWSTIGMLAQKISITAKNKIIKIRQISFMSDGQINNIIILSGFRRTYHTTFIQYLLLCLHKTFSFSSQKYPQEMMTGKTRSRSKNCISLNQPLKDPELSKRHVCSLVQMSLEQMTKLETSRVRACSV